MNIVLVDPPTSFEQIYGDWDLSSVDTYCPPLGLLHIASFVREHGHTPYVIDATAARSSPGEAVDAILALNPDVVGISAKTINVFNAAEIARRLKAGGFSGPVVLGGAHVSACPQETLERFDQIDLAVVGEGEETFLELLEKLEHDLPVNDVLGVVWRDDAGRIVCNDPRPPIEDLDSLPFPAWDLLPDFPHGYPHSALETKRLPSASIMTSRGCPFQCAFCDRAVFGSCVRQHSVEYTLEMIRHLKEQYGIRDLMILDDNFLLDKKKLFRICDAMIEEKMDLTWYCQGHARLLTRDRLERIKRAGCWIVELGIESGCDRILKFIKKNTNKAEVAAAVGRVREAGLKIKGNFIFGFPTETKESLEETIRFATGIGLSYFQQNFLTIWPGCDLATIAGEYGDLESDWDTLAHQRVTFVPDGLKEEDLIEVSKSAFRRFYLRPSIITEVLFHSLSSYRAASSVMTAFVVFLRTILRRTRAATRPQRVGR